MSMSKKVTRIIPSSNGKWIRKTASSAAPNKKVIAINKHGVKIEVISKMPSLPKDTVLFAETKRPAVTATNHKFMRLKALNETLVDFIITK
ncbi:hypothetical protein PaecuDRAFT_3708 [Paenibacillus curdlanolyticus YK9]|uniref:Uncharacterized protein n=1 Tax=Paenibacillus curdlanolyticus YK9 TaxID=717606 RepID=E0IDK4_9BACL|nr:hypothetical protein [Paenibacillus curdlanolyticus]EFM09659.1 hypothetical protein PaecuDRAFT_3708 [Paenibacillus curdlanolyticus YK9]